MRLPNLLASRKGRIAAFFLMYLAEGRPGLNPDGNLSLLDPPRLLRGKMAGIPLAGIEDDHERRLWP